MRLPLPGRMPCQWLTCTSAVPTVPPPSGSRATMRGSPAGLLPALRTCPWPAECQETERPEDRADQGNGSRRQAIGQEGGMREVGARRQDPRGKRSRAATAEAKPCMLLPKKTSPSPLPVSFTCLHPIPVPAEEIQQNWSCASEPSFASRRCFLVRTTRRCSPHWVRERAAGDERGALAILSMAAM